MRKNKGIQESENRQGRKRTGRRKVSKTSTVQTITRSTGENEFRALRYQHTDKSSALITHRNTLNAQKGSSVEAVRTYPTPIDPKIRVRSEYRSNGKTTKHKQLAEFTHKKQELSQDRTAPIASGTSRSRRTCTSGTEKGGSGPTRIDQN